MTMSQAAEAAVRAGLDEICITDHVDTIYWGTNAPRDSFDWEASRAPVPGGAGAVWRPN